MDSSKKIKKQKVNTDRGKQQKSNVTKKRIELTDILIFLTIFIIFGLALLSCFPGLLTSDCIDQIGQAQNNSYTNAHPIFHSFLVGNLTKLGGIWVPALFQILVFTITWTYGCKTLRKYNITKRNKIFQIVFTFIMCIIPLNFLYSITLWKDILYSYSILAVLIFVYIGIKEKYNYTIPQLIWIGVSTVAIMKLRHNGVPIGFIMFVLLLVLNFVNKKKAKQSLILIASFVITFILMTVPQWIWEIKTDTNNVSGVLDSTKVYCMGALLNTDIQLEQEEVEFLNTIMDVEKWRDNYNPYTGSNILFNSEYHSKVLNTEEGQAKFYEIFMKYAKQKPWTIIKHFINVNSIWWSIPEKGGMHSIITNNNYLSESSNGVYDNHPIINGGNEFIEKYAVKTMSNSFIYEIIYRPAVAILVSVVAIIAVCFKDKKKGYLLILVPMILNIGTYVFLISSQDQRYFYPCYMTEYMSILIFANTFIERKSLEKRKNNEKINTKNPKTLVIIPAYNEEEAIEKVVNSVYEQKIENCDVIVINDGSKDNTYNEAKKTKATVIDAPNNLGIGGAVQTGYLYAQENNYDIAIQLDGDGQHNPVYLRDLIEEVKNGTDLVIGSRFVEKTNYDQTFFRMLGINVISFTIKLMTGEKLYDTTSGFRAANKNIIEEFAESYPYDYPEPCTNMSMIKKGYKVKEIPVEMKKRETGVSSISPIKAVGYMIKVTISILLMGLKD